MDNLKGFEIIHLNVRSFLKKKKDELYLLYNTYDIVCFTETWLTPLIPHTLISWSVFSLWRNDRYRNITDGIGIQKGGGILIYVSNKYS